MSEDFVVAQLLEDANKGFEFDNWEEALNLYKLILEKHHFQVINIGHVYCRLGALYKKGYKGKRNITLASKYFSLALKHLPLRTEQGDPEAICDMGYLHNYGYGVKRDATKAAKFYQLSADAGYPRAQSNLAYMLLNGMGVEKSESRALEYYHKAASQGYVLALSSLGYMYEFGHGSSSADPAKAVEYYQSAAEKGYALAQYNLGYMYDNGSGVPADKVMALKYYRLASEQGNIEALCNLGYMYENGLGNLQQDKETAFKYYAMAAEQEYPLAQYNLGCMYINGFGVKKDVRMALRYYTLSAVQGYKNAKKYLNEIFSKDENEYLLRREYVLEYVIQDWKTCFPIIDRQCQEQVLMLIWLVDNLPSLSGEKVPIDLSFLMIPHLIALYVPILNSALLHFEPKEKIKTPKELNNEQNQPLMANTAD